MSAFSQLNHKWEAFVEIPHLLGPSGSMAFIHDVIITADEATLILSMPLGTATCGHGSLWSSHFWEVNLNVRKAVHGTSKETGQLPVRDLLSGAGSAPQGRNHIRVSHCRQEAGCLGVWDSHLCVCLNYPQQLRLWAVTTNLGQELGLWEGSRLQISQKTAT